MKRVTAVLGPIAEPFRSGNRVDPTLVVVFLVLNGLVFLNALLHDPRIGYDAHEHLRYLRTLSGMRLVTHPDSQEFFSPPLPYFVPALFMFLTGMELFAAAKLAQLQNVVLSIGVTLSLLRTCQLISPHSSIRLCALVFMAILPVYYKTFAFMRGEPFVVFFSVLAVYYTLMMLIERRFSPGNAAKLGVAMGLCVLSRQWGILIIPAICIFLVLQWVRLPDWRAAIARTLTLSLILTVAIGGWFYASLHFKYGSIAAFNRKPALAFAFSNQSPTFYFRISPELLFSKPVRPAFPNQLIPIFYSEIWGDYWGYFAVYGKDTRKPKFVNGFSLNEMLSKGERPSWLETNYEAMSAYLGRVNLISLFPSALAVIALILAAAGAARLGPESNAPWRDANILLLLAIAATIAGYFWFLVKYPNPGNGDTIKATYVLQVSPFVAILVGELCYRVKRGSNLVYCVMVAGLLACGLHNVLAMVTQYQLQRLP